MLKWVILSCLAAMVAAAAVISLREWQELLKVRAEELTPHERRLRWKRWKYASKRAARMGLGRHGVMIDLGNGVAASRALRKKRGGRG